MTQEQNDQNHPTGPIDVITPTITSEPSVPAPGRRDWQRLSLFAGGIVFAIGNLLHPLEHNDAAYHSGTWQAAHLTIFFSIPLLVLGLPYLHRQLAGRVSPRLASIAVAASMAGLIGIAPGTIIETFVAPLIGHHEMHELESGGMGAVNGVLGVAFLGGTIALGWAVSRAKLRPRWAGPSLLVAAVAMLVIMSATGPAAGVVIITATVIYGAALSALAATS
jgi:hypothetical protein